MSARGFSELYAHGRARAGQPKERAIYGTTVSVSTEGEQARGTVENRPISTRRPVF